VGEYQGGAKRLYPPRCASASTSLTPFLASEIFQGRSRATYEPFKQSWSEVQASTSLSKASLTSFLSP